MKIAVTSAGKSLDSKVDPRFGRAAFIIVVDPESMAFVTLDNSENVNAFKGAGINAAAMVGDSGADVLLTGFCGPNAFKTLQAAGVKVVSDVDGVVRDAVERFRQGKFSFSENPNAEGHW